MCTCRPRYGALHWLCVLLLLVLLAPFCIALGWLYPRGDDYDFATRCAMPFDILSGLYEPLRQWVAFSGRYTTPVPATGVCGDLAHVGYYAVGVDIEC